MTSTKLQWSINFCIFFSHISAGCQLIEKIKVDSQSIIGALYMIAILTLEHYFDFLLLHLLVHTKLNICYFLLRMSANFKTVWWFFTSLEKPKFDIISFLPEHLIWGLMPYLCTVTGINCQISPTLVGFIYTFSFSFSSTSPILEYGF